MESILRQHLGQIANQKGWRLSTLLQDYWTNINNRLKECINNGWRLYWVKESSLNRWIVKQKTSEQVKTLITLPIYFNDFWPNMGVKKANKIASGKSTIVNYDVMTEKLPIVQL